MEAMSCGLPAIATRWGGNLDFMDDNNSWLIRTDGLATIGDEVEFPHFRGQKWASPSVEDLSRLLRIAASDPEARQRKGARAREDMVARWDWKRIAPLAEMRLREIVEGIPAHRSLLAFGLDAALAHGGRIVDGGGNRCLGEGRSNAGGKGRESETRLGASRLSGALCAVASGLRVRSGRGLGRRLLLAPPRMKCLRLVPPLPFPSAGRGHSSCIIPSRT